MRLFDTNHPFFRPLWIRVAVFGVAAGWGLFELWMGTVVWAVLFLAFAAISFYGFFVDFDPENHPGVKDANSDE